MALAIFTVLVVLLAALAVLALRRRWLARQGGTFECSVRIRTTSPSIGWVLGIARYNGELLEWFRFFSFSLRPRVSLRRQSVRVRDNRHPDHVEAVALYADQRVLVLEATADQHESWSLAMDSQAVTGLLSWLEAAPPGAGTAQT